MKEHNIKVPFYVSTNNKHMGCLGVFSYIFNHFLPDQELRILGYKKPDFELPDNCTFISMGTQGTVNEWSTDLRKYFEDIDLTILDDNGKPIYTAKDLITNLSNMGKVIDGLSRLEEIVKKEEQAANTNRGGIEVNKYSI